MNEFGNPLASFGNSFAYFFNSLASCSILFALCGNWPPTVYN